MEISKEDALWLLNDYDKIRLYGKVGQWIDSHVRAFSIIKGKQVGKPDCNCQYVAFSKLANSMFEQHLETIKQIAYAEEPTTTKTRGRKQV